MAVRVFETLAGDASHEGCLTTAGDTTDQIAACLAVERFGQTGFDILLFERGGFFGEWAQNGPDAVIRADGRRDSVHSKAVAPFCAVRPDNVTRVDGHSLTQPRRPGRGFIHFCQRV